ncbi:undecaprenyl-diphosphate phosphatase [Patescibacteria group bacterium]
MEQYYQSIILGIIQGIGEFLPISSSGHLVLVPWIFDWKEQGLSFDVALHMGTLVAVILYFWRDWMNIFAKAFGGSFEDGNAVSGMEINRNMLWILAIATIPGVLSGLFLEEIVETTLRNPLIIAFNLFFWGLILYLADTRSRNIEKINKVSFLDGVIIGLAQAVAIIPGTSRSGITMSAGLLRGLSRADAARFSFLMLTPIVFGASILKFNELFASFGTEMLIGLIFSVASGYLSIKYLIKFIGRVSYKVFFWYRLALAILIVLLYI